MPDGANHRPLSQSPTSRRASWSPIRNGSMPTGPDLAVRPRVDHHGLAAERARAGEARRLEARSGAAGGAFGGHRLGRRRLAGGRAQGRVERRLDDLDRRLDDRVAVAAIGADQLGGARRIAENRTALLAGELAQLRRGDLDAALGPLVLLGSQPAPGSVRHGLRRRRAPVAARPRTAAPARRPRPPAASRPCPAPRPASRA